MPRWKSDRCAMRTPSSSGGSPGTGSSRASSRTQPASNQPHDSPAAETAPNKAPARGIKRPTAPESAPPISTRRRSGRKLASGSQLLEDRGDRDDVPLELELRLLEAGGDADELGEVEDRHAEVLAGRLPQLRLPRVEGEMAERARGDDRVGARLPRLLDRLDQLAERGLLAGLDDREPAALDLRGIVDGLAPARFDDPFERPRAVRILEAEYLRRPQ